MKTIYAFYMSCRYWFSSQNLTCLWIYSVDRKKLFYAYEKYLTSTLCPNDDTWEVNYNALEEHGDFKHMTPRQLSHARRKLIYEFFKTR